jgi:hypothetical protein
VVIISEHDNNVSVFSRKFKYCGMVETSIQPLPAPTVPAPGGPPRKQFVSMRRRRAPRSRSPSVIDLLENSTE